MAEEPTSYRRLTQEIAWGIVRRYCEYDFEIPIERRIQLLADEFRVPENKVSNVLILLVGKDYDKEPFKEYKGW